MSSSPLLSSPPPLLLPLPLSPCRLLTPPLLSFRRSLPWVLLMLPLPLPRGGTIPELGPFPPLHHVLSHPGGPRHPRGLEHPAQKSPPVQSPQSPSHHLFSALLEISLRICPLHRSLGNPTSTSTLFQGIVIAVRGMCTQRFIMISRPSPKIQSSEIRCA